jgi:hypothetical protein
VEDGSMIVLLGRNRFLDCVSILAYKARPLLQVALDPLRIDLATPDDVSSVRRVRVTQHERGPHEHVRVVASAESFVILWDDYAVAVAIVLDHETILLKVDLRPLGINIYDDFVGLHIGGNVFSGNEVRNAAVAINLGQ